MKDKRPDPKPRKHPQLWQAYLWWHELVEMRKRHLLRISSIERGKSNLDAQFERDMMDTMQLDALVCQVKKTMINYGQAVGPVWNWMESIKGLAAGSLSAQLLARIDNIGAFSTVSKLWRFSGWAVINGEAERNKKGETSHFDRKLKAVCWNIADQFIKQQTPVYVDIYYEEKERQRRLHPEPLCRDCGAVVMQKGQNWRCPENGNHKTMFTPAHLHNRAIRKMIKIFLQHLWVQWRKAEGLPVSKPYVVAILGHTNVVEPGVG